MDHGGDDSPARPADDAGVRRRAVVRAWACPGGGFALVGRPGLAAATYLAAVAGLLAVGWAAVEPGPAVGWAALILFGASVALWVVELVAVPRTTVRPAAPAPLARGYPAATAVVWLAGGGAVAAAFLSLGSVAVGGAGMAPTIGDGERVVYHKRSEAGGLRRGQVTVFRTSARSAWQPGAVVVGRVAAGPGDRIATAGGRYLVNGEPGPSTGGVWKHTPVVAVPPAPAELVVPDGCYFMVQDNPEAGSYDSRMWSWAESQDIVSGRILYLRLDRFLERVE